MGSIRWRGIDIFPGIFLFNLYHDTISWIACIKLIANGGDNEGLFRAVMGDSPSLSFVPPFDGSYVTSIYQQFAGFAYVIFHTLEASHFLTFN